jgi:hypothetical protein
VQFHFPIVVRSVVGDRHILSALVPLHVGHGATQETVYRAYMGGVLFGVGE